MKEDSIEYIYRDSVNYLSIDMKGELYEIVYDSAKLSMKRILGKKISDSYLDTLFRSLLTYEFFKKNRAVEESYFIHAEDYSDLEVKVLLFNEVIVCVSAIIVKVTGISEEALTPRERKFSYSLDSFVVKEYLED